MFKREDEDNDAMDDQMTGNVDEDNERVSMNFRERMRQDRQETRNNFLTYEQGSDEEDDGERNQRNGDNNNEDDDEDEDEEDRWEKEQIMKGVQISQVGKRASRHLCWLSIIYQFEFSIAAQYLFSSHTLKRTIQQRPPFTHKTLTIGIIDHDVRARVR